MGRGVYFIDTAEALTEYLQNTNAAYIQEYLPLDRDIRVVVIGKRIVHAYWRIAPQHDFRSNVAVGGVVNFDTVPSAALDLALHTAISCGWDDVGIDICQYKGRYYVIEANMKYGKEGFRLAGIDYYKLMDELIKNGEI